MKNSKKRSGRSSKLSTNNMPKKSRAEPQNSRQVKGSVRRNERGFGWLDVQGEDKSDIFIPPRELRGIFSGDIVSAELVSSPKGLCAERLELRTPREQNIVGVLRAVGNRTVVMANEEVTDKWIDIDLSRNSGKNPKLGEVVEISVRDRFSGSHRLWGDIVQVLGKSGSLAPEIAQLITESNVRTQFDDALIRAAREFGELPKAADIAGRADLQKLPFVTIDGETAKDFDDAVFATRREGKLVVFVAIADVAHYVEEGKALDVEALARGNSIYYPGKCIPMLPEALSNGLCSLNPKVPRLTMVAEFEISKSGAPSFVAVYEATIKSKSRLTYNEVQHFLNGESVDRKKFPVAVQKSLNLLEKASSELRKDRIKRGAIDFDVVESVVALDDRGEPVGINPTDRLEANRLIEDLMVAANEIVAQFLETRGVPAIYRVHGEPDPEKIANFFAVVQKAANVPANLITAYQKKPSAIGLSKILGELKGHSNKSALDMLLLRSMMQALYHVENSGHFGLASISYGHFTSPIRRYPDLVVHRMLKLALKMGKKPLSASKKSKLEAQLTEIAAHCSSQEREAMVLERKISALHSAWYMRDKIGEEDEAKIVGCAEFGVFVKLSTYHVEGLVHISLLSEKHLDFDPVMMCLTDPGGKRVFAIGDTIRVTIAKVDIARRLIDLEPAGVKVDEGTKRGQKPSKPRRRKN